MKDQWLIIKNTLREFEDFKDNEIEIDLESEQAPRFFARVKEGRRVGVVKYSWSEPSNTIDVLLVDEAKQQSFIVYMTGYGMADWPQLIKQAYLICDKFLTADYTQKQTGFLKKKTNLYFDHQGIKYKFASPTKKFITPGEFLS